MLEGRFPLLQYSFHSFCPVSFSVLTKVLAASKERALPFGIGFFCCFPMPYPSQSGMETHPASRYIVFGSLGILEGRFPLLQYSFHSF